MTQAQVPDLPPRAIPTGKLKPKKAQTDKPLELEMVEIEAKQEKLFGKE